MSRRFHRSTDAPTRRSLIAAASGGLLSWVAAEALAADPRTASAPVSAIPRPPQPRPQPPALKVIALDPGHGGSDPGAVGLHGHYEKTVTFMAAQDVQRVIQGSGRFRCVLVRERDELVSLRDRVARARAAKADLFLSLHADAHPDPDMRGASVYTLSEEASDREAEALAQRENRADAVAGVKLATARDDVASAIIGMAQRGAINGSRRFAETLVEVLPRYAVGLLPQRPHRHAGFAVLTAADIPAVLLEMGYLTNVVDEALLVTSAYRLRIGRAILAAVDAYFPAPPPPAAPARPPSAIPPSAIPQANSKR
jgi:N-acetylmuramoyl-L-alanine amidase